MPKSKAPLNKEYVREYKDILNKAKHYVNHPDELRRDIELEYLEREKDRELLNIPVPKPDEFSYKMIQYNGFIHYPERLKNFIIAKNELRKITRSFFPVILDIEPTSRCNFRCIMCQLNDWKNGKRADDLKFDDFKKIIDEQYGLTEIKLQGMGEPLLNKEFFKMIEYVVKKYIWIRTTVNGSLLHINDNYRKLVDSGVNEIQISVDGATKKVFEKIRRNSNFDKVVENLKMLNNYSNSKNKLVTRMWVLLQEHNKHQVFEFLDLAKHMEFKRLTYSIGMSDFGQEKWNKNNKSLEIKEFLPKSDLSKLLEKAKNYGIEITRWNLEQKYNNDTVNTKCPWPFNRAFISSDLKIVPCCMIGNPDVSNFGDARDLVNIWNGKIYQNFRKSHLEGKIPKFCKNCYKI